MKTFAAIESDPALAAWEGKLHVVSAEARFHAEEVSVPRAIQELLRIVRDLLRLEVVFISEVVDGQRVFRYVESQAEHPRIQPGQSAPLEQTICQRILDGRLPALIPNVTAVRQEQGLPANFEDLGAHIGVPVLRVDGTLYGMLCGFNIGGGCDLNQQHVKRLELAARAAARLLAHADGREVNPIDPALV